MRRAGRTKVREGRKETVSRDAARHAGVPERGEAMEVEKAHLGAAGAHPPPQGTPKGPGPDPHRDPKGGGV